MPDKTIFTPYFLDQPFDDLDYLIEQDWAVNRPSLPPGETQERMAALYEPLAREVAAALENGRRPVSMAGDCCASLGMAAGLERAGRRARLIWFDAHGDFNTWETSPSGFLGGMPLAWLVGRGQQTIMQSLEIEPIPETDVTLTDARDLDPLEARAVETSALNLLRMVNDLQKASLPWGPLWIHFDVDVLDPAEVPAMSYPAPGGPSVRVIGEVFDMLAQSRQVAAVSVSLWNPELDEDGRTQAAVLKLLRRLLA